jgi:hypothetical protein
MKLLKKSRQALHCRRWLAGVLTGLLASTFVFASASANHPCDPPNVIPSHVCNMDSFTGGRPMQLPVGWNAFVLYGNPEFIQDEHTFFGGYNLTIASTSPFKAGIYTQVAVTPGAGYRASIAWGAPNQPDLFGRQLGIDPTGGVDPNAATVIWGPMHWGEGRILNYPPPDVNIDVRARALGETITVFFLTDHPQTASYDLILVDAIALYPDESAPAVELPPTATPTPEPAPEPAAEQVAAAAAPQAVAVQPQAPAAVYVPPTDTPTATPTETPTAVPTDTPTATATPSPTHTPTLPPTATWTPLPSATPEPPLSIEKAQAQAVSVARAFDLRSLLFLGGFGFGGALIFGASWGWLHFRRRS